MVSEIKVWVFFYCYKNEDKHIDIQDFKVFKNKEDAFAAMYKEIGEDIHNNCVPDNWIRSVVDDCIEFYEEGNYIEKHSSYRVEEKFLR